MTGSKTLATALAGAVLACGLWSTLCFAAAPEKGKVTGIVTEKAERYLMVKAEGASEPKRYLLAAEGGGAPTADLQRELKAVFPPNLVALEWQGDEPVVTSIHVMAPKKRTGTMTGTVVASDSKSRQAPWLEVKPSGRGFTERYWPCWVNNAWDKNFVSMIGGLSAGDKVKVTWSYDERKRAVQVQVIKKAAGGPGS